MSRLLDHAVVLLTDELRRNVPAALVAADLKRHGLPLEDPAALRAMLVDRRWREMVDGFIGKTIPSQRGRKRNPTLRTAILAGAFYAQPRDGRRKTAAKGAAASLLGVTSAKVDKAVRSMERAIEDGDALSAAVLAAAQRSCRSQRRNSPDPKLRKRMLGAAGGTHHPILFQLFRREPSADDPRLMPPPQPRRRTCRIP